MSIVVKCFAALREHLNLSEISLEYKEPMTVADVWNRITCETPPKNLLSARNYQYVEFYEMIEDGDEIAFFPPVTGG